MTEQALLEYNLVDLLTIQMFFEIGYEVSNCYVESFGPFGSLGRENSGEV